MKIKMLFQPKNPSKKKAIDPILNFQFLFILFLAWLAPTFSQANNDKCQNFFPDLQPQGVLSATSNLIGPNVGLTTKPIKLFDAEGKRVPEYRVLTSKENLVPGTILSFGDGEEFQVISVIAREDKGASTIVIHARSLTDKSLPADFALRIPNSIALTKFINETVFGYSTLAQKSKTLQHVPEIYRSLAGQYVACKFERSLKFSLYDFLFTPESIDPITLVEAEDALLQFGVDFADFAKIGDFQTQQLHYDHVAKSWKLLDWTNDHEMAKSMLSDDIFSAGYFTRILTELNQFLRDSSGKLVGWEEKQVLKQRQEQVLNRIHLAIHQSRLASDLH